MKLAGHKQEVCGLGGSATVTACVGGNDNNYFLEPAEVSEGLREERSDATVPKEQLLTFAALHTSRSPATGSMSTLQPSRP